MNSYSGEKPLRQPLVPSELRAELGHHAANSTPGGNFGKAL